MLGANNDFEYLPNHITTCLSTCSSIPQVLYYSVTSKLKPLVVSRPMYYMSFTWRRSSLPHLFILLAKHISSKISLLVPEIETTSLLTVI